MSSVSMSKDSGAVAADFGPLIPPHVWVRIAVFGSLFLALFYDPVYRALGVRFDATGMHMIGYAWADPNWSHALIVPFISLYFLYQHRDDMRQVVAKPFWPAALFLLLGICLYALTIGVELVGFDSPAGHALKAFGNDMFRGYAMILALAGLVWMTCGHRIFRFAWFPIFYLVFAVKISDRIWNHIAERLQDIAAKSSGVAINVLGLINNLEAEMSGNTINLYHHDVLLKPPLNVAEACSGIRMLMTFIALGFAVAYLAQRPWWARLVMIVLTIPIAILINVARVTTLGMIRPYYPQAVEGEFHIFIGMLMLIPALGLFMFVGWILNQLIIQEPAPGRGHLSDPAVVDPADTKGARS